MNYYGVLAVIVVLGFAAVGYSRYEYQNVNQTSAVVPTIGSTIYTALATENCGTLLSPLPPTTGTATTAYTMLTNGVLRVKPTLATDAGLNATAAHFILGYNSLNFDSSAMTVGSTTYRSGSKCAAGTKYAGQTATLKIAYWPTIATKTPVIVSDPQSVHFTPYLRVTFAFVPSGVTPLAPPSSATSTMYAYASQANTTSTTVLTATTTTTTPAG